LTERVVAIGAGGHAHVVIDAFLLAAGASAQQLVGIFDDDPSTHDRAISGVPVLGTIMQVQGFSCDSAIIAIGDNHRRSSIFRSLRSSGIPFLNVVHPSAVVAQDVHMGEGVVICAGAIVNPATIIGDNVILNTDCSVDHHNALSSHCHIAPGCRLGGNCSIGEKALVGIGSTVLPGLSVGADSVVGAGSVVIGPVAPGQTVVGNPARSITG
jgi:sugar O-acyltransferase (sialic acid O-acetyltransferase NeuD family)